MCFQARSDLNVHYGRAFMEYFSVSATRKKGASFTAFLDNMRKDEGLDMDNIIKKVILLLK